MIVVDASVWIDYFAGALAAEYQARLVSDEVMCPAIVDFEVGSASLRRERAGRIAPGAARAIMEHFTGMDFRRENDAVDLVAAFDLTENARYADALYVMMAKRFGCDLMTSDGGMVECARIAGVKVIDTREAA